ncbi:hypothetical protein BSLG_003912 [Batrachochytrium salamandrivorans]|nr:hypothetical protein BSLG_003912 [Batrachochytrium salamandrivorans]
MKMVKWAMTHNVWLSTTFEVQCILGWGGCGVVLGATRRSNNEEVAIKIIYRQLSIACTPDGLPKEIGLHQFLEHPNIVESIEHSSDDRAYYLVMERFGVRWNNHTGGASITIPAIDPTLQDVSNDLASVHNTVVHHPHRPTHERRSQGVVHGDIKEENILVGVEAETLKRVLKLCDFGYSRKGIPGSAPMQIYGTREFCPPELVDNMIKYMQRKKTKHGVVGYAQDVWALGLVLMPRYFEKDADDRS